MKFSVLIPAKNEERYIGEAIESLMQTSSADWEVIVINDHSEDETFQKVETYAQRDARVKLFNNPGRGKVDALNFAFLQSSGDIIKILGADDSLHKQLFEYCQDYQEVDAYCHDFYITDEFLAITGTARINISFLDQDYCYCLKYLKSLPSGAWLFTRLLGEKVFPIPETIPFEDVWCSLVIKRFAREIRYIPKQLYYYRQHGNQTYGGLLNFDWEVQKFRANRMLSMIDGLEQMNDHSLLNGFDGYKSFIKIKTFYSLMAQDTVSLFRILTADTTFGLKSRLFVYKKCRKITPFILNLKWITSIWSKKVKKAI